ncbi:serine/threonine-protein kinase [Pannus brasiliensis CCIBt3594]|uniref:Serine/threonine-protein kinase B n=1 Tax=Pannus brasiliensis CCIBt3594 TaxID=1427578 RepID=A0AAW9QZI3_9CHRO
MTYCVNPACTQPKNAAEATVCQNCGSSLCLHGRYQVLGILGKGGFGATFASSDLSLPGKPLCVVKQLRPATNDPNIFRMAKELFEREAETLGKVGIHPQVPRLLDYFEETQQFYLVQEYVKGRNLHQEVRKGGPFSEAGVKQFLSELLPILQYIHEQKVIHRDIKPANLIRRQTDRKLVLIDFGAVKNQVNTVLAGSSNQTALTAFAVGTQGFAPPEQMAMRPVYASDIYAVGMTCLYLLTGRSPKDLDVDANTGELLWERWIKVSPPFAKVIKTMIEVSVQQRYKSAREVLDALDMVAYSDSLADSLTSTPTQARARSSDGEPMTTLKSSGFSKSSPNSNVSTTLNSSFRRSPTPSPAPSPAQKASSTNDMGFQMANTGPNSAVGRGKAKDKVDVTAIKKKPRLEAKAIIEGYANGRRDFAQEDIGSVNLSRARLPGINFYQSKLTGADLHDADLSSADLGRANLAGASLKGTNLNSAYLGYADLERADLRGADLTGANLRHANFRGTNLCGANLTDAQVSPEQLSIAKTNWLTVMPSGKRGFW